MKIQKTIYVLGAIIIIGLIVVVVFDYKKQNTVITENNLVKRPIAGENPDVYAQNLYKVQLSLNSEVLKPMPYSFDIEYGGASNIGNYLIDVLQLGKPVFATSFEGVISRISYNSTQGDLDNEFSRDYFVFLKPGTDTLDTGKKYKTRELTAMVSKVESKLLPYLQDVNYCEADSDCSIGDNFCSYASYNKFRNYSFDAWGCEGAHYPQENEEELRAMCDAAKQYPEVKYTGSKCINNKCVAQNREVVCIDGTLP